MVVFSGGKAVGGPQSSGLLIGSERLIDAARLNAVPNEGTVGRVAKVAKEDIVALWKAIQIHLADGDQIADRCSQKLQQITAILTGLPQVSTTVVTPPIANHFPHLLIRWGEQQLNLTTDQLAVALRQGSPPIATGRVYGTGTDGLLISPINLQTGEASVVGQRILDVFRDSLERRSDS